MPFGCRGPVARDGMALRGRRCRHTPGSRCPTRSNTRAGNSCCSGCPGSRNGSRTSPCDCLQRMQHCSRSWHSTGRWQPSASARWSGRTWSLARPTPICASGCSGCAASAARVWSRRAALCNWNLASTPTWAPRWRSSPAIRPRVVRSCSATSRSTTCLDWPNGWLRLAHVGAKSAMRPWPRPQSTAPRAARSSAASCMPPALPTAIRFRNTPTAD